MKSFAKNVIVAVTLWGFIFAPATTTVLAATQYQDFQAGNTTESQASAADGLAQAGGQCIFGSMLSQLLQTFIAYLLEQMLGDLVEVETTGLLRVPIQTDMGTSGAQKAQRAKDVCALALWGYCILPSLDAIAFCFINEVIHYIAQATIEWIKSGFEGSPAFIDDPEKFFTDAADTIAGSMLNQITGGLLCEPYRAQIQIQLLNEHVGTYRNSAAKGCKISEVSDNWDSYLNGDSFDWGNFIAFSQNSFNNPMGSYLETKYEFSRRIVVGEDRLKVQIGWSDGFLHIKDKETGKITTPGRLIEDQLNRRLGSAENRLLVADEFDEVINTLVNQLIKMALSELLDGSSGSSDDDRILGGGDSGGDDGDDDGGDQNQNPGGPTDPDGGTDGVGSDLEVTCTVSDDRVYEGVPITVTANVTGAVGTVSYDWDGDFSGFGPTATSTFTEDGGYSAIVKVSDEDWDEETDEVTCKRITIVEDFEVACTVSDATPRTGDRVVYTAEITGADGDIVDLDWTGAASGQGETISKVYRTEGVYEVDLEVADEEGNRERVECPRVSASPRN